MYHYRCFAALMAISTQVLPRRWAVERALAWLGSRRRLSKHFESLPDTTEAWIHIAMILTPAPPQVGLLALKGDLPAAFAAAAGPTPLL